MVEADPQTSISNLIRELKLAGCLKWGAFTLKNGDHSNYYIDLRESTFTPQLFKKLVTALVMKIRSILGTHSLDEVVISGVPYGVVPIASAVAYELGCRYAPLRKEVKPYGRVSDLSPLKSYRFILIEDVMCSGSSIKEAVDKLTDFNVTDVVVIANRESGGDENLRLEYPKMNVHSILKASDMVDKNK